MPAAILPFNLLISIPTLTTESWVVVVIGISASFIIAYFIYFKQKKEAVEHLQKHESRFDELKQLHQQDSEKIKVLYELITQSQRGSVGEVEAAVLEQKIEIAAEQITEQDSDHAQALKAIAEMDKEEADELLDKISQREHDLVEVYDLRAKNEYRNGFYTEAVKWYRRILELEPENFTAFDDMLLSMTGADDKLEARKLAQAKLDELDRADAAPSRQKYDLLWNIQLTFDIALELLEHEACLNRLRDIITSVFGEESSEMADLYHEQGTHEAYKGRFAEAEKYYQKALALKEKLYPGVKDEDTSLLRSMADAHCWNGQFQEAVELYDKVIQQESIRLGADHPVLIEPLKNQSHAFTIMGKYSEAEANLIRAIEICEAKLGTQHEGYLDTLEDLSGHYMHMGEKDKAEAIIRKTLEVRIAKNGAESLKAAFLYWGLGIIISDTDVAEAEKLLYQALSIYQKYPNEAIQQITGVRLALADLNYKKGNYEATIPEYLDIIKHYESLGCNGILGLLKTKSSLVKVYQSLKRYEDAEILSREIVAYFQENNPEHPSLPKALENLAEVLETMGRTEEADEYKAKAEELKARLDGQTTEHTEKTESTKG